MKNEFELSNEFEVLSDGSFQFKRKVSLIQFLGGFIFAGIPIFALLLVRRKLLRDFLFREAGSFDWQLKYDTLQLKYAYENHKVIEEINLALVFILVYISAAIFYRNILFKITKNHKITLDKLNKIVHFEFYKKSFAIPFAELSHFKIRIEKEMSGARGRPLVKVYVVCLTKKDGEEYELILDASFWIQPYPVESFINKLSQHYANDVIITESQKIGFQPIKSKQHVDGSNTITLQRWNLSNQISAV